MTIPIHTGPAAPYARLAAYWLARLAEWQQMGGDTAKGLALCRENHARCVATARKLSA